MTMNHAIRLVTLAAFLASAVIGGMRIQSDRDHHQAVYQVSPAGDLVAIDGETTTTFCMLHGRVYAIADASCAEVRSASTGKGSLR